MSEPSESAHLRQARALVHGRYWVVPPASTVRGYWLIGFHGYGQSADEFLESLIEIPGRANWLTVSVQALRTFYTRSETVVGNWMTRQDREHAIADNVAYVDTVMDQLEAEFGAPRAIVVAGFSQGVAMAYRAALLGRRACAAIVVAGGDVPPEFKNEPHRAWPLLLAATGSRDPHFTPELLETDIVFLNAQGADVQKLVFDGAHEWAPELATAAGALLARVEREIDS